MCASSFMATGLAACDDLLPRPIKNEAEALKPEFAGGGADGSFVLAIFRRVKQAALLFLLY